MNNRLLQGLDRIARREIEEGQVWKAVLSQMYLDTQVVTEAVYDQVVTNNATISRVALSAPYPATYGGQKFDALYVVNSARTALIGALPEDLRESATSQLTDVEYLRGIPVPSVGEIGKVSKDFRNGAESHGYREIMQNYAQLYSRSVSIGMKSGKLDRADILVLALLSDKSSFDAHLVGVSQDHRDWLLSATMVRKSLYESFLQPDLESEDLYSEVERARSAMLSTISHLQDSARNVRWAFDISALEWSRKSPEPVPA